MNQITVRLIALPDRVEGITVPDENCDFNIYINNRMPREKQERILNHEIKHIKKNHFYNLDPVARNEDEADGKTPRNCNYIKTMS